jgi:hypothetical protein
MGFEVKNKLQRRMYCSAGLMNGYEETWPDTTMQTSGRFLLFLRSLLSTGLIRIFTRRTLCTLLGC